MFLKEDFLSKNLDRVNEWIRFSDQKVQLWLAFEGLLIGVVGFFIAPGIISEILLSGKQLNTFLFLFGLEILSLSLSLSVVSIIPKISILKKKNKEKRTSLIYFADVASITFSDFAKKISNMSTVDYLNDLMSQIHINSTIAKRKFNEFIYSVVLFFIGLLVISLCLINFLISSN